MANQNIEMKHLNGSGTYDTLYPKTLGSNVIISDAVAMELGLGSGATVDQALDFFSEYNLYWWRRRPFDNPDSDWEYIKSTMEDAYPIGVADGYMYEYLGIPFSNAVTAPKIVLGSYIGTGMAGADNPTTLSFDFVPKILFLSTVDNLYFQFKDVGGPNYYMMINGITKAFIDQSANDVTSTSLLINWEGKTVSWYHESDLPYAGSQFNTLNQKYLYVAIG